MKDYREIKVWQRSHLLTLETCRLAKGFPKEQSHGLTSQLRRSASIDAKSAGTVAAEILEIRRMLGSFIQKHKA